MQHFTEGALALLFDLALDVFETPIRKLQDDRAVADDQRGLLFDVDDMKGRFPDLDAVDDFDDAVSVHGHVNVLLGERRRSDYEHGGGNDELHDPPEDCLIRVGYLPYVGLSSEVSGFLERGFVSHNGHKVTKRSAGRTRGHFFTTEVTEAYSSNRKS